MPNLENRPLTASIKVDPIHNLEMHANLATETAEVVNLVDGKNWTDGGGGGGDSDFSTAEVTIYNTGIEDTVVCRFPITMSDFEATGTEVLANYNETGIYNVVLYKGAAIGYIQSENWNDDPVCTGDITFSGSTFVIRGNGTITFVG